MESPIVASNYMPLHVTKLWKNIAGQGSRRKRNRFREIFKNHLGITSDEYFYQIMRGEVKIPEADASYCETLLKNIRQQF